MSVRGRPVPPEAPPQLGGRALPRYGSGPGSIPGRGTGEFDARPGQGDVQVAGTGDTPRSKRGALTGVRVRLPPWTTMEGEPARRRRRREPGRHRQGWGSRPSPSHHREHAGGPLRAQLEGDLAMEPDLARNECASSPAWGSSPPPSAWSVNAEWSAARVESVAVPRGAEDRALRAPLLLERHLARGCQPVCYAVNSVKERQVRLLHVPLSAANHEWVRRGGIPARPRGRRRRAGRWG